MAAAGAGALALLATQTRGAWLGAALALAVAWPRLARPARVWLAARPRAVVAALAVAAVLALVPLGARAAAGLDPDAAGGRGRLDDWVVAARVVAAHPLTGVGPEGYRIVAPAHVDDGYARRHGRDEVLDRAHNGPLDVAVSAGLPAAALYVVVLGGVVVAGVRVVRRSPDPVLAGAAVGVVAWVGQLVVGFPIAEVDPLAWLLAGAVVAGAAAGRERRPAAPVVPAPVVPSPAPVARLPVVGRLAVTTAAVAIAVVVAAVGWTGVAADRDLYAAERAGADRAPAAAVAAADRAAARRPDDIDAWYVAARLASAPAGLPAVDAGLDRVEEGLSWSRRDPRCVPCAPTCWSSGRCGRASATIWTRPSGRPETGSSTIRPGPGPTASSAWCWRRRTGRPTPGPSWLAPWRSTRTTRWRPRRWRRSTTWRREAQGRGTTSDRGRTERRRPLRRVWGDARAPHHDARSVPTTDRAGAGPSEAAGSAAVATVARGQRRRSAPRLGPAESVTVPDGFVAFYRETWPGVARALAVALGDRDLAVDATDEAMARAYPRWSTLAGYDNPGAWVYRVGLNWARSHRRRISRRLPWAQATEAPPVPVADPAVRDALLALPLKLRSVVVCRLLLDWSVDDTATALGVRPGTVQSRLHRALRSLHVSLDHLR